MTDTQVGNKFQEQPNNPSPLGAHLANISCLPCTCAKILCSTPLPPVFLAPIWEDKLLQKERCVFSLLCSAPKLPFCT